MAEPFTQILQYLFLKCYLFSDGNKKTPLLEKLLYICHYTVSSAVSSAVKIKSSSLYFSYLKQLIMKRTQKQWKEKKTN